MTGEQKDFLEGHEDSIMYSLRDLIKISSILDKMNKIDDEMRAYEDIFSPIIQGYHEVSTAFDRLRNSQPSSLEKQSQSQTKSGESSKEETVNDLPF